MLDWPDATDRLRAAKEASGLTFAALAGAVDRDEVWTASLLLGAGNDSEVEARAPCAALDVTEDEVVAAVQRPPIKGQSDPSIPSDHMLYRLYEILQVYGDAIKACVHEEFGDGIMSATDVECHVAFPTRTATGSGSPTKGSTSRTESDSRGLSRPAVRVWRQASGHPELFHHARDEPTSDQTDAGEHERDPGSDDQRLRGDESDAGDDEDHAGDADGPQWFEHSQRPAGAVKKPPVRPDDEDSVRDVVGDRNQARGARCGRTTGLITARSNPHVWPTTTRGVVGTSGCPTRARCSPR
jgi:cyanate lyase